MGRSILIPSMVLSLGGSVFGCGVSVGPTAGRMSGGADPASAGVSVGYRRYTLADSEGLVMGGDAEGSASGGTLAWKINGGVGYGVLPLPHTRPVGIEALWLPGYARPVIDGELRRSYANGWQVAVPIRVSPGRPPWAERSWQEPIHLLIPALTVTNHVYRDGDLAIRNEVSVGVSYRYHPWATAIP